MACNAALGIPPIILEYGPNLDFRFGMAAENLDLEFNRNASRIDGIGLKIGGLCPTCLYKARSQRLHPFSVH